MLDLRKEGVQMPWQERTIMAERQEFVTLAKQEGANITALCHQFGISRKTGYKWLGRAASGDGDLRDSARRPHTSPGQTPPEIEAAVLALREVHPAWGGRKLHAAGAEHHHGHPAPPWPARGHTAATRLRALRAGRDQ